MRERMYGEIKRTIVLVAALLLLGLGVMLFCEWRGNLSDTLYVCRKMILAMPVVAVPIGMAHYHTGRGLSSREYITQIFCGNRISGNRNVYMDYARIIAAGLVILNHACSMQADADVELWKITLLKICMGISLFSNPLYVMISGSLLLSGKKEENPGAFYFRRFVKVVLPMVIYYIIFLCISGQISLIPPKNLGEGALQILAGASGIVPHYWLIYVLISLYITAPFMRAMVKNLKDSYITVLFFLILIEEGLAVCLPAAGVQIGITMNLASWEGVFILGYILTQRRTKWMERFVLICGGISAVIILSIFVWNDSLKDYISNTSPVMVLFGGAVLTVLSKLENNLKGKFSFVTQTLSKYSYSIILVHWYGLFVVTWGKIGIQPLRFGCAGGIVLTVLAALAVCFILGFTAENTIVLAVQYIVTGFGHFS